MFIHCSIVSCERPGIFVIIIIDLTVKSNKQTLQWSYDTIDLQ